MNDRSAHARAALSILGAALLWSTGGVAIKLTPLGPLGVACGRSLITAAFYLLVLRPRLSKASVSTAVAYAGMILTFVSATKLTTAANAIFLQYTGPAYVLVLAPWLLKERFRALDAVCVGLSLVGMALFFVGKVEAGQALGNALGAASGVFFGLTVLLLRRDAAHGHGDAIPSTTLGNLLAAGLALPFAAPQLAQLSLAGAMPVLYLGVVQMGLAYLLFARGLKKVPAAEASLLSMLEPTFNPVWVFIGTAERPGGWALAGGAVVIASVVLRTALAPSERAATAEVAG
jgi:drug/metabolite transporter (DMT)-like permease